ncbi:MAG TPA: sulfotransferase domain-containing protein [Gammaproteobacteria bacterium]
MRRPKYVSHDGFLMPLGFPLEGFASGLSYRPLDTDVFVASYPKCGTTWTQYLVYLLLGGEPLGEGQRLDQVFPHLEEVGREAVERLPEPRLVKTHLPFGRTPFNPRTKYVYVARNPFDCAVSFYHHTRGFVHHYDFADGTFAEFFECFVAGEVDFGDYFANLSSWYAERSRPNLLFVRYEDLARDARGEAVRIAEFLGGAAARTARDPAALEAILAETRFDNMSKRQSRWSSARPAGMPPFVRKGVVGDWRNHFTAEQAARLLERFDAAAAGTGLERLWPDVLEAARSFASGREAPRRVTEENA